MIENSNSESQKQTYKDYLDQAVSAATQSEPELAIYLYLAAFRAAAIESPFPHEDCITGLKTAWNLAYNIKNRTLAELIFEQLEHFLSRSEIEMYAEKLQDLALDKLEEFGVSRGVLQSLMEMLPDNLAEMGNFDDSALKILQMSSPFSFPFTSDGVKGKIDLTAIQLPQAEDLERDLEKNGKSTPSACGCGHTGSDGECCSDGSALGKPARRPDIPAPGTPLPPRLRGGAPAMPNLPRGPFPFLNGDAANRASLAAPARVSQKENLCYKDLAGFESTIEKMKAFGIGSKYDAEFDEFIAMLNKKHGLDAMPSLDTLIFRAPAREDANRFMEATFGELKLPGVRMHVEENPMGEPVLCVMAQAGSGLRMNAAHNEFEGAAVLLLEDIDAWGHVVPSEEEMECPNGANGHLTHAAFEALRLITSAVENPDVYVLASCEDGKEVDASFLDILGSLSVIQMQNPTPLERRAIWSDVILEHSSVSGVDIPALVECSSNMARYDIYMAAREAIDASYKASLASHEYTPVTTSQICERLAAYQPLDSKEYQHLEEMVIEDFRDEIASLESFLSGELTDSLLEQINDSEEEPETPESDE